MRKVFLLALVLAFLAGCGSSSSSSDSGGSTSTNNFPQANFDN